MTRNEVKVNKIVGISKNNELAILEDVFRHSNNFKGATGYRMRVITQSEIDELNDFENADKDMWQQAVAGGYTEQDFESWWKDLVDEAEMNGCLYPYDDTSFRCETNKLWDRLSEEERNKAIEILGIDTNEFFTFTVSSCGRTFKHGEEFALVLNQDCVDLINEYEEERKPIKCNKCGKEIGGETHEPVYHDGEGKEVCETCDKEITEERRNKERAELRAKLIDLAKRDAVDFVDTLLSTRHVGTWALQEVVNVYEKDLEQND